MSKSRLPTHEDNAADAVDAAVDAGPARARTLSMVSRAFWWLTHHCVARPLALAVPVPGVFRFSAWTLRMLR